MGLEEILSRIESDTNREVEEILSSAERQAKSIVDEAKSKSVSIAQSYEKRAIEDAETHRKESISSATLESRIEYEKAVEEVERRYNEVLLEKIREFTASDDYLSFMIKRIQDSCFKLGENSVVYVLERDAPKLKSAKLPAEIKVDSIDPIGGFVATSGDGKLIIDGTFSQMLRKKKEEFARIIRNYVR